MLSTKLIVLVVHVTLAKPNVMQKLDVMNKIIELKVQSHRNTFETTLTTVLHGFLFQILQKMLGPERTLKHHLLQSGKLILTNKTTLKCYFYMEMVSLTAFSDIMQTP